MLIGSGMGGSGHSGHKSGPIVVPDIIFWPAFMDQAISMSTFVGALNQK